MSCSFLLTTKGKEAPFPTWTLAEAVALLNDSSWAKQETFTRVIGGIGSGIQGEKEIYSTYFVRFLSAAPIRQAYARIQQIQAGYDNLPEAQKEAIDESIEKGLNLDVRDWIVVALAFRSNSTREQSSMARYFQAQTTETIKTRAYLSTDRFPRVQIQAYFPPKESTVGAKFVFPRRIGGVPVVEIDDNVVVFEFDAPGSGRQLRARFQVSEMSIEGNLEI